MVTYSYRAFSKEEIDQNSIPSTTEIHAMDNINLSHLNFAKRDKFIKHYLDIDYDYLEKEGEPFPILFKDIALITNEFNKTSNNNFNNYWTYHIYDSEYTKEDGRVLECSIFNRISKWDSEKEENTYKLNRAISFKIKVQHIHTFLHDIDDYIYTYQENKVMNKFVVPIYLFGFTANDKVNFMRFSDYYDKADYTLVYSTLLYMKNAISYYTAANAFVWSHLKTVSAFKTKVYDSLNRLLCNETMDIEKIACKARSNKKLVISLDFTDKIDLTIHPRRRNMYIGTSTKPVRFCEYKFQVIGHYQHYWVGKGKNKKAILKYINPYYKNKDKEFKIIKEYQSEETVPED